MKKYKWGSKVYNSKKELNHAILINYLLGGVSIVSVITILGIAHYLIENFIH